MPWRAEKIISARYPSAANKKTDGRGAALEDHWLLEDICPGASVQISEGVTGGSRCTVRREVDRGSDRRCARGRCGRLDLRCRLQQGGAVARTGCPRTLARFEVPGDRDLRNQRESRRTAPRCRGTQIVRLAPGQPSVARRPGHPGALFGDRYRAG